MASSFMQVAYERFFDQSDTDGVGFVESFLLEQFPSAYKLTFEHLSERVKGARRDHLGVVVPSIRGLDRLSIVDR